ncbi:hypothetical protein MNB_ARC-1_458 [hydrothermal vent metagenome]|uniref:AB hydrolase-1 domain-containing protein n=1 Tax=hydrothermal vent metagenome TaxID=652676 RepID=A0A3B1DT89_9ZZZZ
MYNIALIWIFCISSAYSEVLNPEEIAQDAQQNIKTITTEEKVSQIECKSKGDGYIFAGGECIQYIEAEGDKKDTLNIIVHGAWKEGTDTLARYAVFVETINLNTDITTVAVALPGYSQSSTNNFKGLLNGHNKPTLVGEKKYIVFMNELIKKLKQKYKATTINYIGHSAGAILGATITGYNPKLIQNIVCAGGAYDIHKMMKNSKNLISLIDVVDNVDKSTNFLIVYGTKDTISTSKRNKNFYKALKSKGLNVKLIKVKGAKHLDLDMTSASVDAITQMIE